MTLWPFLIEKNLTTGKWTTKWIAYNDKIHYTSRHENSSWNIWGKATRLPINWQISRSHPHPQPHLWTWHWWQWWGVEGRWVVMTVAGGEARGEEVMTWTSGDTVVNTVVTGGCGVNYQTWHNGLLTVSRAVSGPGPGFCCGFPTLDITSPFLPCLYLVMGCGHTWGGGQGLSTISTAPTTVQYTTLDLWA